MVAAAGECKITRMYESFLSMYECQTPNFGSTSPLRGAISMAPTSTSLPYALKHTDKTVIVAEKYHMDVLVSQFQSKAMFSAALPQAWLLPPC